MRRLAAWTVFDRCGCDGQLIAAPLAARGPNQPLKGMEMEGSGGAAGGGGVYLGGPPSDSANARASS